MLARGVAEDLALKQTAALLKAVMQNKNASKDEPLFLSQPVLFGKPEADYFVDLIVRSIDGGNDAGEALKEAFKEHKKSFRAVLEAAGGSSLSSGIEGAMFGRFVTSDILARTDASIHVAHAFTVHPLASEVDFFTVVDDLKDPGEDAGAAHAGDMELGAGVFYSYVVVDIPLLVSNIAGCSRDDWRANAEGCSDARATLDALVQAIATVTPGAKLGSTAPYARAEFVLLETGDAQPRTLANAFLAPISPRDDVVQQAVERLDGHIVRLDAMYGIEEGRSVASTKTASVAENTPLAEATAAALDRAFVS